MGNLKIFLNYCRISGNPIDGVISSNAVKGEGMFFP